MKIGIDFDNTISCYDQIFKKIAIKFNLIPIDWQGGKKKLRDYLRTQKEGEETWMRIQGQVYGKYMNQARLMPGVANFLSRCFQRGIPVYIVSHKTEYGYRDEDEIPLRIEAMKWMDQLGFFDKSRFGLDKKNVFFAHTRIKKIRKIISLDCTHFIDDLEEVFNEPEFPNLTKKILFASDQNIEQKNDYMVFDNWTGIGNYLLGRESSDEISMWARTLQHDDVVNCNLVKGQGNSRIFKINFRNSEPCALKYYPDRLIDGRKRLITEFKTCVLLRRNNILNVQKAIEKDEELNLGLFEWVDGKPIVSPTKKDFQQVREFVNDLYLLSLKINIEDIPLASEACLSAKDLIKQVEQRLFKLKQVSHRFPKLEIFLNDIFKPLWNETKEKCYVEWPANTREKDLPKDLQTLSPSDFGFHNALKRKDGSLYYLDFEYFGRDDPVKLIADFIWHPAMNLHESKKNVWVKNTLDIFSRDKNILNRFQAALPLFGFRWVMIILNEFLLEGYQRRIHALEISKQHWDEKISNQLKKALDLSKKIKSKKYIALFT